MSVYEDIKTGLQQAIEYEKGGFSNCDIPMPQGFGKQEGWICPVCGRGVAPWASSCPCQSDWKITYGTSTGGANTELNKLFELNDARVSEIIEFNKKYGD